MPGTFSGINMASGALRLFQRALDTTGHNIANVNTPGYSRQTIEFKTLQPLTYYSEGWKALGTGVGLGAINRVRDAYLEASARNNAADLGKFQTLASTLRQIEGAFNEPGDMGISAAMNRFFDSWSALGSNPNDAAARMQVQSSGTLLTSRFRNAYQSLLSQGNQVQSQVNTTLSRVNQLGNAIQDLNRQITQYTATGGHPNDLLDQRDAAVRELSSLINTQVETFEDGSYAVYVAGYPLVDQAGSHPITGAFDPLTSSFVQGSITYTARSGQLAGLSQAYAQIEAQKGQLDTLANELRTQFNTVHQTGIDQDGNSGVNFFNDSAPQTGAIDFNLSSEVLASPRAIAAGSTGQPGDGGLALIFSQMRDTSFAALGNQTFQGFYSSGVSQIGTQAAYYKSAAETEEAVATQIENQTQAVSGVSLDDEMAEMMRFQRSYQATARALTVFDQVTEDLIAMLAR